MKCTFIIIVIKLYFQCGLLHSCVNGGSVLMDSGINRCMCQSDFIGINCQYLSYCDDMTCGRNGHCNRVSSPTQMPENYGTLSIQHPDINFQNYLIPNCMYFFSDYRRQHSSTRVMGAAYLCHCDPGWYGTTCRYFNACSTSPCKNDAACTNTTTSVNGYVCTCVMGFFERNCIRYDPCSSSPCQNHGRCTNITDTHYQCDCRPGYHG